MVVTDLTYQLSPGMQIARQQQTVSQMQVQQDAASASRALEYQRAEAELQAAYDDLERTSSSYNELVDAYNAAERASEQASMDALIEERAAEYNAAVRRYNEAGNRYQNAGVITGFSAIEEFTPVKEERKPTLSALPEEAPIRETTIPNGGEQLGTMKALGLVQGALLQAGLQKSQEYFQNTAGAVKQAVDFIQTPANASPEEQAALKQQRQDAVAGLLSIKFPLAPDNIITAAADALTGKTDAELLQDQRDYMTSLGKTQIALGSALSTVSPQVGQLLRGSGEEILVSRDFQTEGLISTDGGMIKINRPSVYEIVAFGAALGAAGAAAGSGAVTGVSGFGKLFPKASTLTIEGAAVPTGYAVGGGSAGQALANAAAADTTAKTALAGASALGISLSEVDYGIGDLLDQYPRRDQEEDGRGFVIPGDVVIGDGVMDEYPPRSRYGSGSRYSRNNNNRNQNQDWNRSEIDYRGSVGSGYSTRLVEDSALRTRNQNQNQNRYRNEYDYVYEFAALTEVAPRARRSASWNDEEEDVIAPRKKQQKGKKKHFTERLIL